MFETSRYKIDPPEGLNEFRTELLKDRRNVKIENIETKGKFLYWSFDNNWYMFNAFGMTGQYSENKGKHPCFAVEYFQPPMRAIWSLFFNDPRHFGTVKFTKNKQDLIDKLNYLGWDPFTGITDQSMEFIKKKLKKDKRQITQILMDQSYFAGVGNYIKADSLYLSKLSPHRIGNQLSNEELYTLCQAIVEVVETSYKCQGATISTYKTPQGAEGKYSSFFQVYGKKEDQFGNKIIKEILADKRTTHWCPAIQK